MDSIDTDGPSSADVGTSFPSFSEFVHSEISRVIVHDPAVAPQGSLPEGVLRAVPLFIQLGVQTLVLPESHHHEFELLPCDQQVTGSVIESESDVSLPAVQLTTANRLKNGSEAALVRHLLEQSQRTGDAYVLIVDTSAPRTPTHTPKPGKTLPDEYDVTVKSYEWLSKQFFHEYADSTLPLSRTRNTFYHELATENNRAGIPSSTIADLFRYDELPTASPAWDVLARALDAAPNDIEQAEEWFSTGVGLWTETGGDDVAKRLFETLATVEFDADRLESYRTTNPEQR